jgi:L-malate glycosyltransferase
LALGDGGRSSDMKILFCVEFYYPSMGGAQEVVRQVASRLVRVGHEVKVATSRLSGRTSMVHEGVEIVEFDLSGNLVRGIQGNRVRYQSFLADGDFDVVMFYAAQQWTFDAAWPIFDRMRARKVLVPCGYSGLFESTYEQYFKELPVILRRMDAVVYHAHDYRDVRFAASAGIDNAVHIPNGADADEFGVAQAEDFRRQLAIPANAFVVLTVGTLTGLKGHLELAQAFHSADFGDRDAVLILNGNTPELRDQSGKHLGLVHHLVREYGIYYAAKYVLKVALNACGFEVGKVSSIQDWVRKINTSGTDGRSSKQALIVNLSRRQVVQAFLNADLFVFASNIEYSPLVLFEACAAGLPFLSVPVGNAVEIAAWTGGGEICPADLDDRGYTRVDPAVLARKIEDLQQNPECLSALGKRGKEACQSRYNWDAITSEYESLFEKLIPQIGEEPGAP